MRFERFLLLPLLAAVCVTACTKDKSEDDDMVYDGKFEFAGKVYETMQQVVDAAMRTASAGESGTVRLTGNARGDGAFVNSDFDRVISFDFGGYTYRLNDDKSINLENSTAFFNGSGGCLKGEGEILKAKAGLMVFEGNVRIKGDIRSSSDIVFCPDFFGSFDGNVILDGKDMSIYSTKGSININELEVNGTESGVETDDVPAGIVRIGKVIPNSHYKYPVRSDKSGVVEIGSGAELHVHDFTLDSKIPAICVTPGTEKFICAECGHIHYERESYEFGPCPKDKLEHVVGLAATPTAGGNREYWECPFCGKCYADAEGKELIEGSATLLATNYTGDYGLLHSLDDKFDWRNEFTVQTKDPVAIAGIVLAVIGLAETFGMSLPGLIADDSMKWADINTKLDEIKSSLDIISTKIDQLAAKVDVVAYKTLIMDRNLKFNFLKSKSVPVYQLIDDYLKDKSLSDEEKNLKIRNVLDDWSANVFGGTHIADMTQSLMQQYTNTGIGVTVPVMFEAVANCSYLWEHEGYNFRYQSMAQDVMLSSISYLMACHYVSSVKTYQSEDLRKKELQGLKDDYKVYTDAVKAELNRIKDRDGKFRRLNTHGITFDKAAKTYDFRDWFSKHRDKTFPRENQDGRAVSSCECILKDLGLDKDLGFTAKMAKEIYGYYNRNGKSNVSIYKILCDSVGFSNLPSTFDPGIIFTKNDDEFNHENGDVAIPTYKMFHWESYRSHNYQDYFGIRTCLNNSADMENHNFLYKCDISSWSSGTINDLGKETRWVWYTLVKAEQ